MSGSARSGPGLPASSSPGAGSGTSEPDRPAPSGLRRRPWGRRLGEAGLLLAPLGVLLGLAFSSSPAAPAGFDEAAAYLRAAYRPGDLIAVQGIPPQDVWSALRGFPFLILRQGERVMPRAFRRTWLLAAGFGMPAPSAEVGAVAERRRFERVEVSRFPVLGEDLFARLRQARVRYQRQGTVLQLVCSWRAEGAFRCPGLPDWVRIRPARVRGGGREVGCIAAQPLPGVALRLLFPPLDLGRTLQLRTAFPAGAGPVVPVSIAVHIDGLPAGVVHHRAPSGWEVHRLGVPAGARRRPAVEVVLTVRQPIRRPLCFTGGAG